MFSGPVELKKVSPRPCCNQHLQDDLKVCQGSCFDTLLPAYPVITASIMAEVDGRPLRQFACPQCVHRRPFWNMPPVQKCDSCHRNLRPVDKADEIGYGQFTCPSCHNEFTNGKARWSVTQPCYGANGSQHRRLCQESVLPHAIGPNPHMQERKSNEKEHRCAGCATGACKIRPKSKWT